MLILPAVILLFESFSYLCVCVCLYVFPYEAEIILSGFMKNRVGVLMGVSLNL